MTFLDLSANRASKSTCVTPASESVPRIPVTRPDEGVRFDYAAADQSWTARTSTDTHLFTTSDSIPTPAGSFVYQKSSTSRLEIASVQASGTTLSYSGFAQLSAGFEYLCVTGSPTPPADFPSGASYNFPKIALVGFGEVSNGSSFPDGYDMSASTISFKMDLAARKVTAEVHFIGSRTGVPAGSATPVDFGTATATANIDPATGTFYGDTWTSTGLVVTGGEFGGRFYGPQAREAAFAFSFSGHRDPFDGTGLTVNGTIFAIR